MKSKIEELDKVFNELCKQNSHTDYKGNPLYIFGQCTCDEIKKLIRELKDEPRNNQ